MRKFWEQIQCTKKKVVSRVTFFGSIGYRGMCGNMHHSCKLFFGPRDNLERCKRLKYFDHETRAQTNFNPINETTNQHNDESTLAHCTQSTLSNCTELFPPNILKASLQLWSRRSSVPSTVFDLVHTVFLVLGSCCACAVYRVLPGFSSTLGKR